MGTAAGQAITLAVAPIVTRMYSPEQFGVLASFTAILMIFSSLSVLRFELAFTNTENRDDMRRLFALCLWTCAMTTFVAGAALAAYRLFGRLPAHFSWAIPAGMASIGLYYVMVATATALRDYGSIARTKVWQAIASAVTQIGLGLIGVGSLGLLIGFIVGQSGGIALLARRVRAAGISLPTHSFTALREVALRFRRYPLGSSWTGIMDAAVSGYLLMLLMGGLYGSEVVGFVLLADRIVMRPLLMTGTSLLPVYLGELTLRLRGDQDIAPLFRSIILKQLAISSLWVPIVFVGSNYVIEPLFGVQWEPGVSYIKAIAVASWAQSVVTAVAHTLPILGHQRTAAVWSSTTLVAILVCVFGVHWMGGSAVAVIYAYAAIQIVAHIALVAITWHAVKRHR